MSESRRVAEGWRRCADNARADFIQHGRSVDLDLTQACEAAASVFERMAEQDERRAQRQQPWWRRWFA